MSIPIGLCSPLLACVCVRRRIKCIETRCGYRQTVSCLFGFRVLEGRGAFWITTAVLFSITGGVADNEYLYWNLLAILVFAYHMRMMVITTDTARVMMYTAFPLILKRALITISYKLLPKGSCTSYHYDNNIMFCKLLRRSANRLLGKCSCASCFCFRKRLDESHLLFAYF